MPKRKHASIEQQQQQPEENQPVVVVDSPNEKHPPLAVSYTSRNVRRRCIGEPDVEVIVGGVSFHHYSFLLCYGCDYFDTMLSSGMSESQNLRIEFPDKNPAEWKLVYPFLEPRSLSTAENVKITKENAKSVVPWFHEFGLSGLLKEADDRLWSCLLLFKHGCYPHRNLEDRQSCLAELVEWTEFADTYDLAKTRKAMMKELQKALVEFPELVTKDLLEQLVRLVFFARDLWDTIKRMVSADVHENNTIEELTSNPLFTNLLCQSYKVASLEKQSSSSDSPDSEVGERRLRARRLAAVNDLEGSLPRRLAMIRRRNALREGRGWGGHVLAAHGPDERPDERPNGWGG